MKAPTDLAKVGDIYLVSYNQLPNLPTTCALKISAKREATTVL